MAHVIHVFLQNQKFLIKCLKKTVSKNFTGTTAEKTNLYCGTTVEKTNGYCGTTAE